MIKSPLRYPGGKTRAVKHILPLILNERPSRVCSPFFGGGSVELALVGADIEVAGYDAFAPLANFWISLLSKQDKLVSEVRKLKAQMTKEFFYALQRRQHRNGVPGAARFFAINRASFSGSTLSGGMSPKQERFTESAIDRLAEFQAHGLRVRQKTFQESMAVHKGEFLFLDPPYLLGNSRLYGRQGDHHVDFDHQGLAKMLANRKCWIMTYNDHQCVRCKYPGHRIEKAEWAYGMNKSKQSSEIIIFSKDLS